jgi:hypothetical protein
MIAEAVPGRHDIIIVVVSVFLTVTAKEQRYSRSLSFSRRLILISLGKAVSSTLSLMQVIMSGSA